MGQKVKTRTKNNSKGVAIKTNDKASKPAIQSYTQSMARSNQRNPVAKPGRPKNSKPTARRKVV